MDISRLFVQYSYSIGQVVIQAGFVILQTQSITGMDSSTCRRPTYHTKTLEIIVATDSIESLSNNEDGIEDTPWV